MKMHVHEAHTFAFSNTKPVQASDVIVRLDKAGFVVDASQNAGRLGIDLDAQLVMPHISDLAVAQYQRQVSRYLIDTVTGQCSGKSSAKSAACGVEFPIAARFDRPASDHDSNVQGDPQSGLVDLDEAHEWVILTLSYFGGEAPDDPGTYDPGADDFGLVGTLHTIARRPSSLRLGPVEKASTRASDPFTGLAGRRSFVSSLTGSIAMNETASVALFAIDGMRAIFMKYGQGTADELRWGFARFLEAMVEPQHALAQVDDERFGVVLPGFQPKEAREWAADALQTFAGLTASAKGNKPQLSASAGIARAEKSAEWAIRQAELGLVMARAAGGMQTAMCRPQSSLSNGRSIEEVMENVVDHAARRTC